MISRRALLTGAAALLAAPAIDQPARTIRFMPNVDLPVLDPIANTAAQLRNHAFLVFAIRQAVLSAVQQREFTEAFSNDPANQQVAEGMQRQILQPAVYGTALKNILPGFAKFRLVTKA